MANESLVMIKIAEELLSDPTGRGYAGKTAQEMADLLNNPYIIERIVKDEYLARVNSILLGIENAPNSVTAEQVEVLINLQKTTQGGI